MWHNPQEIVDLVEFTEEALHGKLHFLCSDNHSIYVKTIAYIEQKSWLKSTLLRKICQNTGSQWAVSSRIGT